jgi:hypothetical protein
MVSILVTDENANGYDYNEAYFHRIDKWAQEHCASYIGFSVTDVSDSSYEWDEIGRYDFNKEEDAMLFMLRWPGATQYTIQN